MAYINKLKVLQTVRIVGPNGAKDSINLQPQGRASLPSGWSIDPNYSKEYDKTLINTDKPSNIVRPPVGH